MSQLQNVKFDLIRYANCWEDADILAEALNVTPGAKVLSIASAGDNSFSLLTGKPELVVAVDISKVQLYLVELKKAAISQMAHKEYMQFAGFIPSHDRINKYKNIAHLLSPAAHTYWDAHQQEIEKGIIYNGKFEKYFRIFSKYVLPLTNSRSTTKELVREKTAVEQKLFYDTTWNNWRWRFLIKIFFGKLIMGRLGRDPAFLEHVNISVGEYIFNRTAEHISGLNVQNNCYDDFILFGKFNHLPNYVRENNYNVIKSHIDRLHIFEGYAETAGKEFGPFTHLNLSNIFEYMDPAMFTQVATGIINASAPGAVLAYWNLMVQRRISEIFPEQLTYNQTMSETLTKKDKCFFYNRFIVDKLES